MQFENFFDGPGKVCDSGAIKNRKMSFKAILFMSVLWIKYPAEIKSVKPPYFVMKMMSSIGKLRGIKVLKINLNHTETIRLMHFSVGNYIIQVLQNDK
jgi:hypothetical protein